MSLAGWIFVVDNHHRCCCWWACRWGKSGAPISWGTRMPEPQSYPSGNCYPLKPSSYPLVRGASDINLTNLQKAANKIALFEEKVIYHGLPEANIKGLKMCTGATCLTMGSGPEQLLTAVAKGITTFAERSMDGRTLRFRGWAQDLEQHVRPCSGVSGQDAGGKRSRRLRPP